jgi:hypothetical protein
MTVGLRPVWRPLALLAGVSLVLWSAAMVAAHAYLVRAVTVLRVRAAGGAVGEPEAGPALVIFGFVLGGVLLVVNIAVAVALIARRRERRHPRGAAT